MQFFKIVYIYLIFLIFSQEIKHAWERKKSVKENLKDMGLCYDPNETLGIPKTLVSVVIKYIFALLTFFCPANQ